MAAAFLLTIFIRQDLIWAAGSHGIGALIRELTPLLAFLALVPIYLLVWRFSKSPFGPAWFGTAVLFAWVHARVWPSPIPLLFLALGLG
jgi:hypothetical protein